MFKFSFLLLIFLLPFELSWAIVSYGPSNIPMGLFVHLDGYDGNYEVMKNQLNYICQNHRVRYGSTQYISELVLSYYATVDPNACKLPMLIDLQGVPIECASKNYSNSNFFIGIRSRLGDTFKINFKKIIF